MTEPIHGCTCSASKAIRSQVFVAEREYIDKCRRAGELPQYQELVRKWKHTWGLCPYHDDQLRRLVRSGNAREVL